MFKFKAAYPTPKESTPWVNTCEYIILHHTGTKEWTIKGVLDWLYRRADYASCHFVVDINWDCYKIWQPKDILWHAGESKWGKLTDMNKYSLGIEVIWPLSDWGFTKEQKVAVKKLIQHLMAVCKIPMERVLRHKDIAPKRKWDISDAFWNKEYISFWQYCWSLKPEEQK